MTLASEGHLLRSMLDIIDNGVCVDGNYELLEISIEVTAWDDFQDGLNKRRGGGILILLILASQ